MAAPSPADVLLAVLGALPPDVDLAVVRRAGPARPGSAVPAEEWVVGVEPDARAEASGPEGLARLDDLGTGWWAGWLTSELGRAVERVHPRGPDDLRLPDVGLARIDARLVIGAGGVRLEGDGPSRPRLAPFRSSLDRAEFEDRVRHIVELIRAGECYQVNLTRRLTSDAGLERSAKDRAKNVMITDLARNDLGRVCRPGSVKVPALCAPEAHPGLWHLVSTVTGRLRPGVGAAELVRATFPPASVTGAPKPRVLQAIEDLEPVARGVYCGAVGWIEEDHRNPPAGRSGDEGHPASALDLNVAIWTFQIVGGQTHLGVGGGITADPRPDAEWRETELKAARLLAVAGAPDLVAAGRIGVPA